VRELARPELWTPERPKAASLAEIKALWEAKGGEPGTLPPVTGAGGDWLLFTPMPGPLGGYREPGSMESIGGTSPGELTIGKPLSLLGQDRPTMMNRWNIVSLRIPVFVEAQYHNTTGVEVKNVKLIATMFLSVLIGGDVVWRESIEQPLDGPETVGIGATEHYYGNFLFQADLMNALHLPHGRDLQLRLDGYMNESISSGQLFGYISQQTPPVGNAGTFTQGSLAYSAEDLTGHRVL
jgi:hypothetical protein